MRHFKRSYRQAMRRLISTGAYDPDEPNVVLHRADKRYRTWKPKHQPSTNAVIVYMMDVSGSMGADQKELVRTESFWLDAWISNHYQGTRQVYIVHDAAAKEVDRETFFPHPRIGRHGNLIGLHAGQADRDRAFPPAGLEPLPVPLHGRRELQPPGHREVHGHARRATAADGQPVRLRPGRVLRHQRRLLRGAAQALRRHAKVALSRIPDRNAIADSIKTLLGKGR